MPTHIRALIVILVLSTVVFAFAHRTACDIAGTENYKRRRNLWFALTLAAFLAHNFWVYTVVAVLLVKKAARRETNLVALYFFILFTLPTNTIFIPGMGLINFLFAISHVRILALFLLLPAFFALNRQSSTLPFGRTGPDKALAAYILLFVLLYLRGTTVTDTLRLAFYMLIDIFLPYFVISRSLKNLPDFREALLSLVLAIMVVALLAIFENFKTWLLYQAVLPALGLGEAGASLMRDGILRAVVISGQAIALGYLMATGIGFYLFLRHSIKKKHVRQLGMALLVAGLIAPLSRGPWVGAAVLLAIFIATGRRAVPRLTYMALTAILSVSIFAMLPGGERVLSYLPFVGTVDKGSQTYREELIRKSMIVIDRNPWFGSVDYLKTPEMQSMMQGQGIIDIVNSYIGLALELGYVGAGLFVSFFALTILGIYRTIRSIPDKDSEECLLGRALLAILLATMLVISMTSSITIIPIVYWAVAGMGAAYVQMMRKQLRPTGLGAK